MNEVASIILSAALGGAGCVGLVFGFLRFYIEKRISNNERKEETRKANRIKRKVIDEEWEQAVGRLLFWIVRAIQTGSHNGELEEAHQHFKEVEKKAKDFDREIIASNSGE